MTNVIDTEDSLNRRVVITGCGVVCSLGRSPLEVWEAIENNRSGVKLISRFDTTKYKTKIAAEIDEIETLGERFNQKYWDSLDKTAQFVISAGLSAFEDASLSFTPENSGEVAIVIASQWRERNTKFPPAETLAGLLGITGNVLQISPHSAGGIVAISEAAEMIRRGDALVALAGGVENPITPEVLSFYEERTDLSENNDSPANASRPLDLNRDGFVLAEGSAIVVLEDLEVAQVRGANILAELEGNSYTFSPGMSGIPKIAISQISRSIQSAVEKSGRIRSEIDVVYMNASGSVEEDALEAKGVKSVFGSATRHHMYTPALKGHTGNMFSASGPLGVIVLTEAMQRGKIPSTLNLIDDDPGIDLDANKSSVKDDIISVCIVNAIGGPHNATLVISHPRVMRDY
ncbi:MAG: hypothetical protein MKZ81_04125 [Dehalococcoidia bacterium]|nr:hypothetical protein [Dehalococcoidia bacterium]